MPELNIDTAPFDTSLPLALERNAPANTPAHLSTHDAAAVLRKLRQPQHNETGATGSDPRVKSGDAASAAPAETISS
jgi:hypothetical protein